MKLRCSEETHFKFCVRENGPVHEHVAVVFDLWMSDTCLHRKAMFTFAFFSFFFKNPVVLI